MFDALAGRKSAFLWNWATFGGDPAVVAGLLDRGDMSAVSIKSHDGGWWYEQGASVKGIREELRANGCGLVGSWSYHYFQDAEDELQRVLECIDYGQVDFHILNIEDPAVERNPNTPAIADRMFGELRRLYPDFPLYFCSHAQPVYHPAQPYWQAVQHDIAQMPMSYHTAMMRSPETAVRLTRDGLAAFELDSVPANYAGALYGMPGYPILPGEVVTWGVESLHAGATGLTWWDLDEVIDRPELLDAVRQIPMPPAA